MALPVYLAMTAAEMCQQELPGRCAWMACHFSSYGLGLSNTPRELPQGSLLILNDRIPLQGHDPQTVTRQLAQLAEQFRISGLLLDLQRPKNKEMDAMVQVITHSFPHPVAVTEQYAHSTSCAVFLDSPRAYHSLSRLTEKWQSRELWLEASFSPGTVTVTKDGSRYEPQTPIPEGLPIHRDTGLHCCYCIEKQPEQVRFHFQRTEDDLKALLEEAEKLGISQAIGLYQELGEAFLKE